MGGLDKVLDLARASAMESSGGRDDAINSLSQQMQMLMQSFNVLMASLNNIVELGDQQRGAVKQTRSEVRASTSEVQRLTSALAKNDEVTKKALDFGTMLKALEGKVERIPAQIPKPERVDVPRYDTELGNIKAMIGRLPTSLPKTDLTAILKRFEDVIERLDAPMVVEQERRQWRFDVEREDFSDKITSITATEI